MVTKKKRRYRLGETMYVHELLDRFYPDAIKMAPVRLGSLPHPVSGEEWTPEERALLETKMRWADGIAIVPGNIHLIEAKLLPGRYPEGLTKLEYYRTLIPETPKLAEYRGYTILPELWTPIEDPLTKRLAMEKGIRNMIYTPTWFKDYLASLAARARRSPREELEKS